MDLKGTHGEPRQDFDSYRAAVADLVVGPFAREVDRLADAGDVDGVLDRLEALHAMPLRLPQMAAVRERVAGLFPEPSASSDFDDRGRARRFRALTRPTGPAVLPTLPGVDLPEHGTIVGPARTIAVEEPPAAVVLSPDGGTLLVFRPGKMDQAIDLATGEPRFEFDSFAGNVAGSFEGRLPCAFTPDGARFAVAAASDTARLFDAADGSHLVDLRPAARQGVRDLAFTPDGRYLLVGQADGLWLYDPDGRLLGDGPSSADWFGGAFVAFTPDGRLAAHAQTRLQVWNLDARRRVTVLPTTEAVAVEPRAMRGYPRGVV